MNHLRGIAARLKEFKLDGLLITSPAGEYYAVGFHGEGLVLVTEGESFYITDPRYGEAAESRVTGARLLVTGPGRRAGLLLTQLTESLKLKTLGFEERDLTVERHGLYAKALPCRLEPASRLLAGLRASKGPLELAAMERAQRISERALEEILSFIKPGMTEKEIAARLVYDMLRFGAERLSFEPIVVSGPNGSLPHGVPGGRRVEKGDFITMDFGCVADGYCSDMTRTVGVGQVSAEMAGVYGVVLEAQLAGIAAARAGVPGKDIDAAARRVIERAGYGDYFGHGFGHSLGLEIHESPNANSAEEQPLPAGAVISAEPGIYLPGRFGVRIEDVIVLTQTGCDNLTRAPKELILL